MSKKQIKNSLQLLLDEKIKKFSDSFVQSSRQLFVDADGLLVHPGEFGSYREEIVRDYIRSFTPQRMAIDTGFIINSSGEISTQCDVVIYDTSVTPLLQAGNCQRFFPIESVCAIGEVKSKISLGDLKIALRKLSKVKFMREFIPSPTYVYSRKEDGIGGNFSPNIDERDQIISFLVCESFLFNVESELKAILECYNEELPHYPSNLRHNFILSIKDGLLTYLHPSGCVYPFPSKLTEIHDFQNSNEVKVIKLRPKRMVNRFIMPGLNSFEHVRHFSTLFYQALSIVSVLFPDMGNYIKSQEDVTFIDYDPV